MKVTIKKVLWVALMALMGNIQMAVADTPRPEYPRPQFERADWQNLNGTWTYTFDFGRSGSQRDFKNSKGFDGKITVPFAPESKLLALEENMARALTLNWNEYDLAKAVEY